MTGDPDNLLGENIPSPTGEQLGDGPRGRIADWAAYEFFRATDATGQPTWSRDVADRGAVFGHPGKCYRSGVTYNAGLNRYLWVQIVPGTEGKKADTQFKGGFGSSTPRSRGARGRRSSTPRSGTSARASRPVSRPGG